MRAFQHGPLLLALGVALAGCGYSGSGTAPKPVTAGGPAATAGEYDVAITVPGMS